jgi:hypothetical protein
MDLNFLYSQHQISLIRASDAVTPDRRAFHQALADGFARRIGKFQSDIQDNTILVRCMGTMA